MSPRRRQVRQLADTRQLSLPLGPLRDKNFLSSHWLEHRLPLEPEWREKRPAALAALEQLQALWSVERDRVERYGSEATLEEKFIQPVLKILGWPLIYQTHLDRREPDYALFRTDTDLDTALSAGRTNAAFWQHAAMAADAKAWHVSLDRPSRVAGKREYPPEQIEWYLNHSLCDFGILTNGKRWRLVPRVLGPGKPRFETYLEADLPLLLEKLTPSSDQLYVPTGAEFDAFFTFFLLFGSDSLAQRDGRKALLVRAVEGSSEYAIGVGEELKERVFEALRLCVEGFVKHSGNELTAADLRLCQEHSFVLLYRLLFIMYAEDRGLLPYRTNATYTNNRSLARWRDEIAARLDQVNQGARITDFSSAETDLWGDLQDLFDLIDAGNRRYEVQEYNGGLFDLESDEFLANKRLSDWYLARVIDQLGRAPQPDYPERGLFRVDYRDLAIQQLGSVYEGLLELRPSFAHETMIVIRQRSAPRQELIVQISADLPAGFQRTGLSYPAGSVYLATDKGERRRTGSYYTPDHIVNHIVEETVGALCLEVDRTLRREIEEVEEQLAAENSEDRKTQLQDQLDELTGAYDDRILELKILDPAMGSGHFLIRACQYLAEEIATNPHTRDPQADAIEDESTIAFWKRRVAERCLYGVDLNSMAVELAKLALWLETVSSDAPLTFLDHHLRCGNSIIGSHIAQMGRLPRNRGLLSTEFDEALTAALPQLLGPFQTIQAISSGTAEEVHQKERIYRRTFLPIRNRFSAAADVWVADAMFPRTVRREDYLSLLTNLRKVRAFQAALDRPSISAALQRLSDADVNAFHWEFDFPDVFLGSADGRGFDGIIGNPPYDVLSEAETGRDTQPVKNFIASDTTLQSTLVGKNNFYKLFVARSFDLLREGGRLSFIVPMSLLGDEQASGIRNLLLEGGRFIRVDGFPQKDRVADRVFSDAKLSTALFVYQKSANKDASEQPFEIRIHPRQLISNQGDPLRLTGAAVRLYDPSNLTIVGAQQTDWDLVKQLDPERIARLGDFAEFFQGEVNETNTRKRGHLVPPGAGKLVTRGACICLYQTRVASQGEDFYLDVAAFQNSAGNDTKAFHSRYERVALQESSPQNNFRRVIAARLPAEEFCNHTINYTTTSHSLVDLSLILFVLNSSFADWYFRLGSTNAHVSQYQLQTIPCPKFELNDSGAPVDVSEVERLLAEGQFAELETAVLAMASGVCTTKAANVIKVLVQYIEEQERLRGVITRAERSRLSENGTAAQAILDRAMLSFLGILESYEYIRLRLAEML